MSLKAIITRFILCAQHAALSYHDHQADMEMGAPMYELYELGMTILIILSPKSHANLIFLGAYPGFFLVPFLSSS